MLSALLPSDTSKFYRYMGSLTTPTCNDAVVWTVFQEKQTVSEAQLAQFRTIKDGEATPAAITLNYRDAQSATYNPVS